MAPSFTLKSLSVSPSRPSLPLAIPSTNPSPLPSPGRSPTSYFPLPSPSNSTSVLTKTQPSHHPVNRDEAFKVVRYLEDVLSAWNEYRLALSQAGKAGKKLAGAMKDLAGCMDKTDVPAQTIKPAAAMVETSSDLLGKLSKKVDGVYDQANADASKYFSLLAKESRSHDAYLSAATKKHDKAEKAYRKASKSLGETATAHSGLVALKTSLSEDIARANADQSMLLGSKQAGVVIRMASAIGGMAVNLTSFFSEGLRKVAVSQPDVEYCEGSMPYPDRKQLTSVRALADIHWSGSLPSGLDEATEEKKRDDIRLIKTRVALGEMDIVGEKVWNGLARGQAAASPPEKAPAPASPIPPTPVSAPEPSKATEKGAPAAGMEKEGHDANATRLKHAEPFEKQQGATPQSVTPHAPPSATPPTQTPPAQKQENVTDDQRPTPSHRQSSHSSRPTLPQSPPVTTPNGHTAVPSHATITSSASSGTIASSRHGSDFSSHRASVILPTAPPRRTDSVLTTSYPTIRSLPQSPEVHMQQHQHQPARPPAGPRNISMPGQSGYMGHVPRRSVSQIARDMERNAINERQSTFEAHQSHRSFVAGCSLCSMDYDRMVQMRQQQASRRVTMPPAYSQPVPLATRDEREEMAREELTYADERRRDEPSPWEHQQRQERRASYYAPPRGEVLQAPQPRRATGHSPDFAMERSY